MFPVEDIQSRPSEYFDKWICLDPLRLSLFGRHDIQQNDNWHIDITAAYQCLIRIMNKLKKLSYVVSHYAMSFCYCHYI